MTDWTGIISASAALLAAVGVSFGWPRHARRVAVELAACKARHPASTGKLGKQTA